MARFGDVDHGGGGLGDGGGGRAGGGGGGVAGRADRDHHPPRHGRNFDPALPVQAGDDRDQSGHGNSPILVAKKNHSNKLEANSEILA